MAWPHQAVSCGYHTHSPPGGRHGLRRNAGQASANRSCTPRDAYSRDCASQVSPRSGTLPRRMAQASSVGGRGSAACCKWAGCGRSDASRLIAHERCVSPDARTNRPCCSSSMTASTSSTSRAGDGRICSGSTTHLLPGVVCRRGPEYVRPEVVPADASRGLDCDATIRGDCTPRLPFADRGGFDAKDFGQALLRAYRADSSVDGGLDVHALHLRSNLIYGQQGKPNFNSGIVR